MIRAIQSAVIAIVGATTQVVVETAEKRTTSFSVAKAVGIPINRRIRKAPAYACSAAPPPINSGIATDFTIPPNVAVSSDVQKFTRNDPMTTPGQARLPNKRRQPRARPAAGHIAVAYPGEIGRRHANFPAMK